MSRTNLDCGTLAPTRMFPLSILPAEIGFPFIGFVKGNVRVECRVTADGIEGESLDNLIGWRYPATLDNILRSEAQS